jgi:microcystin-dependent protein
MPFDTSGNFIRDRGPTTWRDDATAGVKIKSDLHDINDNDIADSLSLALLRDGRSTVTADIPWGGHKITNLSPAVNPTDAVNLSQLAGIPNINVLPPKAAPVGADELMIANSQSVPAWQKAKVTVDTLRSMFTPVGVGVDFWGPTAPAGWLFCYGQAVSRTTYAALFAAIGTAHGVGDNSTTFNVPDKRGRASFGKDDMGGTSADRLTNPPGGGLDGDTLGAVGGQQHHVLTVAEMPVHNHTGTTGTDSPDHAHTGTTNAAGTHAHGIPGSYVDSGNNGGQAALSNSSGQWGDFPTRAVGDHTHAFTTAGANARHAHTIPSVGSDNGHNTVPPGIVCNYIINAGA